MFTANLIVFLLFQVIASLFFKWGSTAPHFYWWGFALGNLFGMSSIMMLINIYKVMNANMVLAICTGGAFILNQIAMYIFYKESLTWQQWAGIIVIFFGILMVSFWGSPASEKIYQ